MRLASYYKTKEKAHAQAKKIRGLGATGVRVGQKTNNGYPVYSQLPKETQWQPLRQAIGTHETGYLFTALIKNRKRHST